MNTKTVFLLACSMLFSTAYAATIYQWVDENGRTHISDTVPARYKDVATKLDTEASRVSEKQRQEALERVAREKRQIDEANKARAAAAKAATQSADQKSARPATSGKSDDCEQLMRAYRESQECFAPYMRVEGGTREEAYKYCTPVPDPSSQCGLPGELPDRINR